MARKSSTKVKRASTQTSAERAAAQRLKAMNDVADAIDLPVAQRDADGLDWKAKTNIIDGHKRTRDTTIRKLSRVEKLRNAGVLEKHEAEACEVYADVAELAWATNGCTANYGGVGSGDYTKAALRLGIVTHEIADARESHRFMASAIPDQYRAIFESVICHNASIASVAGECFSVLRRSQREHKTRAIVKFCANKVHGVIAHHLPIEGTRPPVGPTADLPIPLENRPRVTDAILAKITGSSTMIAVASVVARDIHRELGMEDGEQLTHFASLPVVVQESWVTGWMVQ